MADFSHSVQRTQATPTLSKKISNGNGFTAKTAYDDVFGGPPKFGVPTFSSRIDDYNEIFGNFHASRASSIPILDLPVVDERDVSIDVRSTKFDYSEVFGGFNGFDFAISYEDLLAEPKGGESSSEDVWTPAETGSPSEGSSEDPVCSENNQPFLNEESHQSYNGTKQFNMSFHKTNQISKDDGISATTHIAQLNSVPAFTFVVEEKIPLEKTEQGKPLSHETKVCESNVDFSVGILEGNDLKEAISQQPACHTVTETSESDLKPQITPGGNGSFFDEEFLTVAEISLRTRPSHVPPPSRPPPNLTIKQGDSKRLAASRLRASENYIGGQAVREDSPPFFDVEVDASSSAAASAAAMKEAMEKAQARLKSAKESMERKRDGLQNRKKLGLKDDLKSKERKEGETIHEAHSQKERARETFEREVNKMKYSSVEERQTSMEEVEIVPDIEARGKLVNSSKELVEQNHVEESRSTQEFHKREDGTGEWKVQEQYYELVKMDKFRAASEAPKHERRERELMPTQKAHEFEKATLAFDHPDENDKILKTVEATQGREIAGMELEVAREVCVHEEHQNKIKAFEEVHEQEEYKKELNVVREICEQENEKKIKVVPAREEQVKNEKESREWEEHEKRLKEALEWEEHEKKLNEIREWEENEKKQNEAREREQNRKRERVEHEREENEKRLREAREKEENEKRLKEVLELEETVKRQKEAREREEDEIRLKKARELEENEKRLKEARELEENEKRRKEAFDRERIENERKRKEAHAREENEKRLNEAREREENEKRLNEAREREENEKRLNEAREREENEKRLNEAREREENEKRLNEAREREENEKRQKEAREREENEKRLNEARVREENEKRLKEALAREESERRQDEARDREDNEKKLKVAQEAFLQTDEDSNRKISRKSSESDESEEKLKAANEVCKQDDNKKFEVALEACKQEGHSNKLESAQLSCEPEDIGKMMETAKHTSGHTDNEKKLKASEKLANEEDANDRIQKEHVNRSALEHQESSENKKKVASKAKLHDIEKNLGESEETIGQEKVEKIHKTDEVAIELEANKSNYKGVRGMKQLAENGKKLEEAHPSFAMEEKGDRPRVPHEVNLNQDVEPEEKNFKEVLVMEEKVKEEKMQKERDQEKERLRKADDDKEREREREKDRMAVERATREARERAFADARERAERAAVERATAEARQRAMADARERLEKASAEAREKSLAEKVSAEARLRLERAAVERATAEARERAVEKAMADKAALGARGRAERTYSEKFSATSRDSGMRHCSSFNDLRDSQFQSSNTSSSSQRYPNSSNHGASHVTEKFQGAETETAQRCKARLERHQRTVERAAKALAEKNMRDLHTQREQAERHRLADTLDADVKRWSSGKEGNLRALLSTLQYILGPDSGWQPIPLTEVITAVAVKKAYRKATLCVHPDKLQQRGASIHQKYICEKVFDLLKEAWNKFNSEER